LRTPLRVRNTEFGRVVVDQTPGDGTVQDLAKRLRRLIAVALGNRQPPRVHVLRRELRESLLAEHAGGLPEQPAQLRDRHRRGLVHFQVFVDELSQRDRRPTATRTEAIENLAKCFLRLRSTREAADLRPLRAAAFQPVPVRP